MKTFNADNLLETNSTEVFDAFKLYDALHATEDIYLMITGKSCFSGRVVKYAGHCTGTKTEFIEDTDKSVNSVITVSTDIKKGDFCLRNADNNIDVDLYDYIKTSNTYKFNDNLYDILGCMCKYTEDHGSYYKNLIVWISDELTDNDDIVAYAFDESEPREFYISASDFHIVPVTITPLLNPHLDIQDMSQKQFENLSISYDGSVDTEKDAKSLYKFDIEGKDYIKPGAFINKINRWGGSQEKPKKLIESGTIHEIREDYIMIDWINSEGNIEHEGLTPSIYADGDIKFQIIESVIESYDQCNNLPKFKDIVHNLEIVVREDEA